VGAQGEAVGGGGEEFEEAIPIVGSSWDRPLVEPGRYRPGWFTPRGRSDMLLFGLAAAAGAGRPMPEFHWPVSAALMEVPLVGRVWTRRFLTRFTTGLQRLGYRVEAVTQDGGGHSIVVHARRLPA